MHASSLCWIVEKIKTVEFIFKNIHLLGLSGIPAGDLRGQKNISASQPGCANVSASFR
jgi:hypothetical protein